MAGSRIPLTVELEDGSTWDVVVDQRDFAKWELQPFYAEDRATVRLRYVAFNASSRTGKTELSWPKFDAACVHVGPVADAEEVDPTKPDPSGEA